MVASVLVSGTSSGIGKACTRLLAESGFRVYAGVRNAEDGHKWSRNDQIVPIIFDLALPEQIEAAVQQIADDSETYPLTAIVNNAGVMLTGCVESMELAHVRQVFEINLFGQWHLTQLCIPLLRKTRGRIINIGSTNGRMSGPKLSAYSASKHALEALSETLQLELAEQGIAVTVIEPGSIGTALWRKVLDWEAGRPSTDPGDADARSRRREKLEWLRDNSRHPSEVAHVVLRALRAERPRYRYLVGRDARLRVIIASLLPRSTRLALRRLKR